MSTALHSGRRLLERESERAAIEAALERAAGGRGGLVAVEADAGLGKTTLLRAARGAADAAGIATLSARASELEREFAFGVVRQLFEPRVLRADRAARESLFAGAATLAQPLLSGGWAPEPTPSTDAALPLLHGLYWLLANVAGKGPVLVTIDDVQWADEPSLRFLQFVAPRLEELPVAVLIAARPGDHERPPSLGQLLAEHDVLRPAPLSPPSVASVLQDRLGDPEPGFAAACHRVTGGNPFFVEELVRELGERGTAPLDEHAGELERVGPEAVRARLERRLAGLPAAAGALARAVAVLGDDAAVRHAARLAGVDGREAARLAGRLVRAAVLADRRPLRFLHPIVRAAAYEAMTEPERAALHAAAARLLVEEDAFDDAAMHLLHAERCGDDQVVDVLLRAAERATARGALDTAARFLRRALDEPPTRERRTELLAALGRAELGVADAARAEECLREAFELSSDRRERAEIAKTLAQAIARGRSWDEAASLLTSEQRRLAGHDRELSLELEAEFASLAWMNSANAPPGARLERYARLSGRTVTERKLLAAVARLWSLSGRSAADCAPLARRALGGTRLLGREGMGLEPWTAAFAVAAAAGDVSTASAAVHEALDDARRHGAPLEFCMLNANASALAFLLGDLATAEATARIALEVADEHEFETRLPICDRLLRVLLEKGRLDEVEQLLEDAGHAGELPQSLGYTGIRISRARLRLAQGRSEEAVCDLRAIGELEAALGIQQVPFGAQRSSLALALGERAPEEARRLAEEELSLAREWGAPGVVGVALRALGLVVGGSRGVDLLREAATTLAASERRLEHARALVDLGAALRRGGSRREARETLREGADLALRCGADALVVVARDELRAAGARPRNLMLSGLESLTPMERRIAGLAAQGLKNAEIAQALFVTVKNVEMHLSRAYRKLDIPSRHELPSVLAVAEGDGAIAGTA